MENLLDHPCGSVSAPAGCGKTHLIAETLRRHDLRKKPILVLTHTNAGVAALRSRFAKLGIPKEAHSIMTLDGWTMRLVSYFPKRSGISSTSLELRQPRNDYPAIRRAAITLMQGGHINTILAANYYSCIIDEYQDCSAEQHNFCLGIAKSIHTYVLGDPMQGIFAWAGTPLDWDTEVLSAFPSIGALETPWRWKNENNIELGLWLLECRKALKNGHQIDLKTAPKSVTYVPLSNSVDYQEISKIASVKLEEGENAIIICDAKKPTRHQKVASSVHGASVVENADLTALVEFADMFTFSSQTAADDLIDFAAKTMTGLGASDLHKRLRILVAGTGHKPPTELERLVLAFSKDPTPNNASIFLSEASRLSSGRVYRPDVLRGCLKALQRCSDPNDFKEIVRSEREKTRMIGRSIRKRAVGSTLLVKGLEAEVAVIIDTDVLSAKDLYVAMTRGSKRLVVCSANSTIQR